MDLTTWNQIDIQIDIQIDTQYLTGIQIDIHILTHTKSKFKLIGHVGAASIFIHGNGSNFSFGSGSNTMIQTCRLPQPKPDLEEQRLHPTGR